MTRNIGKKTQNICSSHLNLVGGNMVSRKPNDSLRLIVTTAIGIIIGFIVGVYISLVSFSKLNQVNYFPMDSRPPTDQQLGDYVRQNQMNATTKMPPSVQSNPRGAELLPSGIVEPESDFYLRRLQGLPSEDLKKKPNYLVTFTVGLDLKENINAAVKKFSDNFTILLFHYDGKTSEWDQFEWSKRAIHVSARKQTKWWYAKRFLHPDIVAPYDYIFIWDEDLGVEHFDAEKYIDLVKKHSLEISQPGIDPKSYFTWQMTRKRDNCEVHKETEEYPGLCSDSHLPPCAAFIEIMAPVFSRNSWRCVWHMLQNDLVHGWGIDFNLRRCVENAHEKIGVIDAQWINHKRVPSLGNQGEASEGISPKHAVRKRCDNEWKMFESRLKNAEMAQQKKMGRS